jgi:hypothetical protein
MKVVAGTAAQNAANTTSNASPFQNNNQQPRGPRGGGF